MKYLFILMAVCVISIAAVSQTVGSKVSLISVDGKSYTCVITDIDRGQYKVKYDGYDFTAWLTANQFTVINTTPQAPNTVTNQQQNGNWKVGDKVEAYDMYINKWTNGTITIVLNDRTPLAWRVTFDDPKGHTFEYLSLTAKEIRLRGAGSNTNFSVGSRVDVYYTGGGAKDRASVIEIKPGGRYKVNYDGCKAYWDEEVDWSQLKPASVIANNHPDITVIFGKWAMFTPSYPTTVIRGNDVYREYGMGAKAPPLQINSNGTYVWYDEFNKPPVKAAWSTHAKLEGVTTGTGKRNGIIIKDSRGSQWIVYKDQPDHIGLQLMCSGETMMGSKIK